MTRSPPAEAPAKRPPGRPRRFDEDTVMEAITDLFWSRGFDGVSLSDILDATGLHKGSLYRTFGDKTELYRRALARYDRDVVEAGSAWIAGEAASPPDARARLAEFLSMPIDARFAQGDARGCFLCNASADETDGQPRVRALVSDGFAKLEAASLALLRQAYPAAREERLRDAASLVISAYVGLRVRSRHARTADELERTRSGALAAVDALLG